MKVKPKNIPAIALKYFKHKIVQSKKKYSRKRKVDHE